MIRSRPVAPRWWGDFAPGVGILAGLIVLLIAALAIGCGTTTAYVPSPAEVRVQAPQASQSCDPGAPPLAPDHLGLPAPDGIFLDRVDASSITQYLTALQHWTERVQSCLVRGAP